MNTSDALIYKHKETIGKNIQHFSKKKLYIYNHEMFVLNNAKICIGIFLYEKL